MIRKGRLGLPQRGTKREDLYQRANKEVKEDNMSGRDQGHLSRWFTIRDLSETCRVIWSL